MVRMDARTLGQRIRAARVLADNMSREELAELVDYHPSEIGRWERGEQMPRQPVIEAIARHTGQPQVFFTDEYVGLLASLEQQLGINGQPSEKGPPTLSRHRQGEKRSGKR